MLVKRIGLTMSRAESQRQQQQQQQQQQEEQAMVPPSCLPDVEAGNVSKALPLQEQRSALKFGFAAKPSANKVRFCL
jgi:small neutral amino acid transporter SnatA (MarC family)